MRVFVLLFGLVFGVFADIRKPSFECPECTGDDWFYLNVPKGNHRLSALDVAAEWLAGIDGAFSEHSLSYQIVFSNSSVFYPCSADQKWCSNQNKLMGFTRGITPVMSKSCMISWRRSYSRYKGEEDGNIVLFGYGWYNSTMKPWQHPIQNPHMGSHYLPNTRYIFTIYWKDDSCVYEARDGSDGSLISNVTTPMQHDPKPLGAKLALYFGGSEPAPTVVSLAYKKN